MQFPPKTWSKGSVLCALFLVGFALFFTSDLYLLKRYLNQPEYVTYYFSFRHWFLENLLKGHFPQWNPYWGIGHSTEIEASFPVDTYSILEVLFGPKYYLFQAVQCTSLLLAAFWSLQKLGISLLTATFGSLFFALSPWTTYYFFYFIQTNSFILFTLAFALSCLWFQTEDKKYLYALTCATVICFFGTKIEFWFFHLVFFFCFSIAAFFLYRKNTGAFHSILWYWASLVFSVLSHAWQIVPLWQIFRVANRLETPPGLASLFSLDLYLNLLLSISSSGLIKTLFVVTVLFLAVHTEKKRRAALVLFALFGIALFRLWKVAPLCFLFGWFGLGSALGAGLLLTQKISLKELCKTFLFFLPLSYYWLRPLPGDF